MKTLRKNIIIISCILFCENFVLAQNWQWVRHAGGASDDTAPQICSDFNGDVYVIGTYGFIFGITPAAGISFNNLSLAPNGDNQIYIAKYSNAGNVIWAKSIGGNNIIGNSDIFEEARSISYDPYNQCIYITGNIYGTANFGSTTLSGYGVCFYAKMDLGGNFVWAKSLPFSYSSNISITCDIQGHKLIYGYTSDFMQINTLQITPGSFVARFDYSGDIIWIKHITSKVEFQNVSIQNGNFYLTINLSNDSLLIDTTLFTSTANFNGIVACFDSIGSIKWIVNSSSTNQFHILDSQSDIYKNVYISGYFQSNIKIGSNQLQNTNPSDLFIAKLDSSGQLMWFKQGYASNNMGGWKLGISLNGHIFQSGFLTGNANFDTINVTSSINGEFIIIEFDTSGTCLKVAQLATSNPTSFTIDFQGNAIVSGNFYFPIALGSTTLTSLGYNDIFLAKYDFTTGIYESEKSYNNNQLFIHANPNEGKCNITVPDEFLHEKNLVLSIYNSSGKLIQQKNLEMNEGKIKLSLEAEAKGLYNAVLSNGTKSYSGKIVFE